MTASHLIAGRRAACVALLLVPTVAQAEKPGRVDLAAMNLPPANVEIDAGPEMISTLLGIGEAAIAGVSETLLGAADEGPGSGEIKHAAGQLEAVRHVIRLAGDVVQEVRVRVYEDGPQGVVSECEAQLDKEVWENAVRVSDGDEFARVSLVRSEGSVMGVFVIAGDSGDLVLANVVCNISPEKIKELTAAATKVGLDNGLREEIIRKMNRLGRRHEQQHAHRE